MFKLYKRVFRATNEGIILTIPIALFWWVITIYIDFSKNVVDTLPEMLLSAVTMLFMISGFCAGWFYMVKKCVKFAKKDFIFDKDRNKESFNLLKAFPIGLGRFFLYFVEVSLLFLGIALSMGYLMKTLSFDYLKEIIAVLGNAGLSSFSGDDIKAFLDKLPPEDILDIFHMISAPVIKIILTITLIPTIVSFLLMLWMPEIIYTLKNPLIALFTSIKKVFVHFGNSVKLYIYLSVLQLLISLLGPFSLKNPILYMLMIIVYFYFLVYVVVLIFSYYDQEFRDENKNEKA